jgi:predicted ATP-grasp superfamily ATP-dependent carboligase
VRQTLDPDDWARVLVIMGASTRAAAFSALRAGLRPICLDQYADADLEAVAEVIRVDDYPDGLPAALSPFPPYPVMYTGALENHPELIEQIALRQPLLGNDAATLRAVRDPCRVREVLAAAKVPHLEVCSSDQAPPADGRWLLKPQRGSCGRGVIPWTPSASGHPTLLEPHFFQERASGTCYSAVFAARQSPLQVRYVGLTRQLVGLQELHAAAFSWCGSLGPALLDTKAEILIRRTGTVLAHRFGLRGLFGFDFILDEDDQPLLTEVNPRYTGSVEVLEQLCELNLLVDHWVGCGRDLPEGLNPPPVVMSQAPVAGKVVLYSDRDCVAPPEDVWCATTPWQPFPGYADIPRAGSTIPRGAPVCSVLGTGTDFTQCLRYLLRNAEAGERLLTGDSPPGFPGIYGEA